MLFGPPQLPPDPPPAGIEAPALPTDTFADGELQIEWDAPPDCGGAEILHGELRRYLAEGPADALSVKGRVEPRQGAWHISLSLDRPGHTTVRELDAPNCEMLARAAALVVAVHVDVIGASQGVRELETPDAEPDLEPEPPPEPDPRGESEPAVVPFDPRPPETVATRTRRPEQRPRARPPTALPGRAGILRASVHAGVGERPGFPGGFGLAGGLQLRGFRAELQLDYALPRLREQPGDPDVTASFQALHGTARGCWMSSYERFEFPLCGGIRAGALRGVARDGAARPEGRWSGSASLAVEPAVVWSPVPRFGLHLGASVLVGLRRPSFRVGQQDEPIFAGAPIGIQLALGLEIKLF